MALAWVSAPVQAEADRIRFAHGLGLLYLPLMVMRDRGLIEKYARLEGLGRITVSWTVLDGGNAINDAMRARKLDLAGIGAPGFLSLWAKARGIPRAEVIGVSALSTSSLWLNTRNPAIHSLADFGPDDRIAVPGIETSLPAVILQMAAARLLGPGQASRLDPLTVDLGHQEAMAALLSGRGEIDAHMASPPFSYRETADPRIHRVFDSTDVLGRLTLDVVFASKQFVDDNPRLLRAVLAAQEEANRLIGDDRAEAARIYARIGRVTVPHDGVEQMLREGAATYSTTPVGVMQYVDFMERAGTIRTRPARWSDAFIPAIGARDGS